MELSRNLAQRVEILCFSWSQSTDLKTARVSLAMPVYECCTDQLAVLAYGSQQLSWNIRTGSNSFRIAGYVITGELQERLRVLARFHEVGTRLMGTCMRRVSRGRFYRS
jgi:hypothetical protein